MNLDKAIKLQGLLCESSILDPIPMYKESAKLGLEALKEIKAARTYSAGLIPEKLPGETDD